MKTLLLCAYRPLETYPLGLERDSAGATLIDRRIYQLRELEHDIICVVGGASADRQLRECHAIADTELAFDESVQPGLLSNSREGLKLLREEACFILPVEIAPPPPQVWKSLSEELARTGLGTKHAFLRASADPAPWHFPLLVTTYGAKRLLETADLTSLADARLNALEIPLRNAG